jgi:hypothetical protein
VTIGTSKLFFIAAVVFVAIALMLLLFAPEVEADKRIAFFYASCLCFFTGWALN